MLSDARRKKKSVALQKLGKEVAEGKEAYWWEIKNFYPPWNSSSSKQLIVPIKLYTAQEKIKNLYA